MSCKLYLVPEDVINTWRADQRASAVDRPIDTLTSQVDDTMNRILNENTSEYDKEKLHSQALAKYMTLRQQKMEPERTEKMASPDVSEMLTSIPKMYRSKASGLLNYLKSDEDVEWDEKGQVYIGNKKIANSHILDLIHDAMRLRKKTARPKGWRELSHHLVKKNMPKAFAGNPEWGTDWSTPPESPVKTKEISAGPSFVPFKKHTAAATPRAKERKSKILGRQKIRGWTTVKTKEFSAVPFKKHTTDATPHAKERKSKTLGRQKIKSWTTVKE